MRLDFVIAGAQKSGTSSLWGYLRQHPQLFLAEDKELHFFDNEGLCWSEPDYDLLHRRFLNAPAGALLGEATPVTLYWTPAHARLFRYNPEIKIILIFRDPVERAFSHWRMVWARGDEPLAFPEAIRRGRARVLQDARLAGPRFYSYVERGLYGRQLKQMLQRFGREQMLFLKTDDLASRPEQVLRRITDFLGVAPFEAISAVRLNVGGELEPENALTDEDAAYLSALYRDDLREFAEITGLDVRHWRPWSAQTEAAAALQQLP